MDFGMRAVGSSAIALLLVTFLASVPTGGRWIPIFQAAGFEGSLLTCSASCDVILPYGPALEVECLA